MKIRGCAGSVRDDAVDAVMTQGTSAATISGFAARLALEHAPPWIMNTWCWWMSFLAAPTASAAWQRSSSRTYSIMRPWIPPAALASRYTASTPL